MTDTPAPAPPARPDPLVHTCGLHCSPDLGLHGQMVVTATEAPAPARPWTVGMVFGTHLGLLRLTSIEDEPEGDDAVFRRRLYHFRLVS